MKEIIKNILNRLNNKNKRLCLYDPEDKSVIIIDKDLLIIIRKYYENQLISTGKETLQYPCTFVEHALNKIERAAKKT